MVRKALLACPKYGNEDEAADSMLLTIHDHICNTARDNAKNTIMHSYLVVIINNDTNIKLGHLTSATADGRMSGIYLANANNPQGGADKTKALLQTYFGKGGAQLMITVVSRDEMEDAMVHPERHKDLIVRVGGFSARFIDLGLDVQQELLSRTLHGGN